MSTQVARDERLTPSAVKLAMEIVAACGTQGFVNTTRFALAKKVNLSIRTVARLLAELRRYGYIATERLVNPRSGLDTGLRIVALEPLRPYYQQNQAIPGVTRLAFNKDQKINLKKEEQALCQIWSRLGIPRSVWEANRSAKTANRAAYGYKPKRI